MNPANLPWNCPPAVRPPDLRAACLLVPHRRGRVNAFREIIARLCTSRELNFNPFLKRHTASQLERVPEFLCNYCTRVHSVLRSFGRNERSPLWPSGSPPGRHTDATVQKLCHWMLPHSRHIPSIGAMPCPPARSTREMCRIAADPLTLSPVASAPGADGLVSGATRLKLWCRP
jgi:hypothetical protein